jgi:hypothetical protein
MPNSASLEWDSVLYNAHQSKLLLELKRLIAPIINITIANMDSGTVVQANRIIIPHLQVIIFVSYSIVEDKVLNNG